MLLIELVVFDVYVIVISFVLFDKRFLKCVIFKL